jgi:hypothetical protein
VAPANTIAATAATDVKSVVIFIKYSPFDYSSGFDNFYGIEKTKNFAIEIQSQPIPSSHFPSYQANSTVREQRQSNAFNSQSHAIIA